MTDGASERPTARERGPLAPVGPVVQAPRPSVRPIAAPSRAGGRSRSPRLDGGRAGAAAPAPVVPPQSVSGRALILVIAIMCYLACLSAGFLTLVAAAADDWQSDVAREVTIQVKPLDGIAIEPRLQRAMDLARGVPGVASVRLVSDEESRRLVEPWLGGGVDLAQLPVPRLIVVELRAPGAADLTLLEQALSREVKGASLDNHAMWAARLRTMAGTMVAGGFAVLLLVLGSMTLSVVFATRAATAGNRDVIEVLHFVGAEDRFIAGEFRRHFLVIGLKGGTLGWLAAVATFLTVGWLTDAGNGSAVSDQAQALFGGLSIGWTGYGATLAIALLVAGLTALTSGVTVKGQLDRLE
jgi:cell division transport system permease protein